MKILSKIEKDEKIIRSVVVENDNKFTVTGLTLSLREGCEMLNISTPVITKKNLQNFVDFNFVRFRKNDFVEKVDFDFLIFERN